MVGFQSPCRVDLLPVLAIGVMLGGGCGGKVVVETGFGSGDDALHGHHGQGGGQGGGPLGGQGGGPGVAGAGSTLESCAQPAQSCSSDHYPAGESCDQCFCRCCNFPGDMASCEQSPGCMAWVACMRTCAGGLPCMAGCTWPCDTGNEPECYLGDCFNWVCSHACGTGS
jgi:hypothetical protein